MTNNEYSSDQRAAEVLRFAHDRLRDLTKPSANGRTSMRWAHEAASLGDVSGLAALTLHND